MTRRAASDGITDAARLCADVARAAWASDIPALPFPPHWVGERGAGMTIGLIDCAIDLRHPDLVSADIVTRDFVGVNDGAPSNSEHGTVMAKLLVGQGRWQMRGVAPRARLYAARVVGPGDSAQAACVAAAIHWLRAMRVGVVAMPIGSERAAMLVDAAIKDSAHSGTRFYAACGSGAGTILFPARHAQVIAVAPCDQSGKLSPDARCSPIPDLVAPGLNINGASPRGRAANGSSIACVLAAGAAALGAHLAAMGTRQPAGVGLSANPPSHAAERSSAWRPAAVSRLN